MASEFEEKLDALNKSLPEKRKRLIQLCHDNGACTYGNFTLKSGVKSNFFFNAGILTDFESVDLLTDLLLAKLVESNVEFDAFIGVPYKAIPLVSLLSFKYYHLTGKKTCFGYYRKEVKPHGEGGIFVGSYKAFEKGTRVVVVEDIMTNGVSLSYTLTVLESTDVLPVLVLIFVNRETKYGKFAEKMAPKGITVRDVMTLDEIVAQTGYVVEN